MRRAKLQKLHGRRILESGGPVVRADKRDKVQGPGAPAADSGLTGPSPDVQNVYGVKVRSSKA